MPSQPHEVRNHSWMDTQHTVIEVTVTNHPGIMSHICNLFSRRAYNVEGILCLPVGCGDRSRIWLLVNAEQRLDQIIKQVAKLEDVWDVRCRGDEREIFSQLAGLVSDSSEQSDDAISTVECTVELVPPITRDVIRRKSSRDELAGG